jgi:hypothetical protein
LKRFGYQQNKYFGKLETVQINTGRAYSFLGENKTEKNKYGRGMQRR